MRCSVTLAGRGTTDAIFIARQLQEEHFAANKLLQPSSTWRKHSTGFHLVGDAQTRY